MDNLTVDAGVNSVYIQCDGKTVYTILYSEYGKYIRNGTLVEGKSISKTDAKTKILECYLNKSMESELFLQYCCAFHEHDLNEEICYVGSNDDDDIYCYAGSDDEDDK